MESSRMHSNQAKIFGIGLSKTGTTSLARALEILEFKTRDYLGVTKYSPDDLSSIELEVINNNDAFTDTPIPSFYRQLDNKYPDSKFILTIRDREKWLKSCQKQFTQKLADKQNDANNQLFMDLYDCTVFDEHKFINGYDQFVDGVSKYFKDRPQDLLTIDVAAGDGWEKLCPFLDKPIPDIPFPRANVTKIRWIDINEIVSVVKHAGETILDAYKVIQANNKIIQENQPGRVGLLLDKASYTIRGGASGIQKRASNIAYKIILSKLKELNPGIPVISMNNHSVPYAERRKWNHFWLLETLDSDEGLMDPGATFTLSIALIEDRRPVLGVVYAPGFDTVYYAMSGKSAFKIAHGGEPMCIDPYNGSNQGIPILSDNARLLSEMKQKNRPQPVSNAFAMCLAAEGIADANLLFTNTMEWQTAGAHAILNSTGLQITNQHTKEALTYNKEQFSNAPLIIE